MSQKTKNSKVRKLLRFLTFLLLTIFTVIVLFGVYITFFFPIKTVQNYLVKFVRNEYQRELVIGDASLHLLHGFEFEDITIHKIPDSSIVSNDFPVLNASVDKILLKYNLRKIFKKQLVVEEIVINSPDVILQIEPTTQTIPVDSIKSSAADTTVPAPVIPIAFNLKTIKLSDLSCDVTLIDSVTMRFSINNVNLTMSDFNIPAGNIIEQDSLLHGQLAVQCKKSHLSFLQKAENDQSMSATSLADLEFDVNLNSLTDITSAMNLSVSDFKFESNLLDSLVIYQLPFPVFLNYQAELNAKENRVNVSELQFGLGGQKWLSLSADVKEYNKNPEFQLKIDRGTIPVQKVIEVARSVIPDSLMPNIFFAKTNPVIDLSGTKIWGHVPDSTLTENRISFIGNVELKNVNSTINQGQGEVEDLHLKVEIQGAADYFGLQDATSQVTVAYDSVFWAVNDTLSVFTGPASLHLTADINNRSVPENIKMEMTVSNLLNSNLTGNVHLYSATDLFSLRGDGLFELYDIDFNSFPQNVLQSRANVRCGFQVNTLDSLSAFVRVITDSLIMPMEYERISFPPLHVASSIKGAVDTTFSDFNFDSCIVKVGIFFEANARVKAHLGDQVDFNASVTDAFVDHAMLFNYIPENFKTAVQDLVVSGKTHVTADVSGFSREDSLFYNAVGKLYTQNLGVEYPSQFIYINNLLLNINTSANSEDGIFLDFKLNIDTTRTDYLPMSVFLKQQG